MRNIPRRPGATIFCVASLIIANPGPLGYQAFAENYTQPPKILRPAAATGKPAVPFLPRSGVAYFQAELRDGSAFKGPTERAGLTEIPAILASVAKEGADRREFWLTDAENVMRGQAHFIVDRRLSPLFDALPHENDAMESFLHWLFEASGKIHGDALLALGDRQNPTPIHWVLLDKSPNLFEHRAAERVIGINKSLLEVKDPVLLRDILIVGLGHELRQMLEPSRTEKELTADDAALLLHLSKTPWKETATTVLGEVAALISPSSLLVSCLETALDALKGESLEARQGRVRHRLTSIVAGRQDYRGLMSRYHGLSNALKDDGDRWKEADEHTEAVNALGPKAAAHYYASVLPRLLEAGEGAFSVGTIIASALSDWTAAAIDERQLHEAEDECLPALVKRLKDQPDRLKKALGLVRGVLEAYPNRDPHTYRQEFGIYFRAQDYLDKHPEDVEGFLLTAKILAANGQDPNLPQLYMRKIAPEWSIPQTPKSFPAVVFKQDGSAAFSAQGALQVGKIASFVRWLQELTDGRVSFEVTADPSEREFLAEELGKVGEVALRTTDEGFFLTVNPDGQTPEEALKKIAETPAGETPLEVTRPAPPDASSQEKIDALLVLDQAVSYILGAHVSKEHAYSRYASYSEPAPRALAELYSGGKARDYYLQMENELKEGKSSLRFEDWHVSMQKLGDSLLDAGALEKANSVYRESVYFGNALEIALSLAKAGEDAEAFKYIGFTAALIQSGLPQGLKADALRWKIKRMQALVDSWSDTRRKLDYQGRLDRLYRRLVNAELADIDKDLERSVRDWTLPERGQPPKVAPPDRVGITAFLEAIWAHPLLDPTYRDFARMGHSRDGTALASIHGTHLKELYALLTDILDSKRDPPRFVGDAVDRLWDNPVKAGLYRRLAGKFDAGSAAARALLARADRAQGPSPASSNQERTVWETEVFPDQSGGIGLRTRSDDPRAARLKTLSGAAARKAAEALADAFLETPREDGLVFLRYMALRAYADDAAKAGAFADAREVSFRLSNELLKEAKALRELIEAKKAAAKDASTYGDSSQEEFLRKMGTELGLMTEAKIALAQGGVAPLEGGKTTLRIALPLFGETFAENPENFDEGVVLRAAAMLAEKPALLPVAESLLRGVLKAQQRDAERGVLQSWRGVAWLKAVLAITSLPRAELVGSGLTALLDFHARERGKSRSEENEGVRDLEYLSDLLELVRSEPELSAARARLVEALRAEYFARHRYDPEADILKPGYPPIDWSSAVVKLARALTAAVTGPLDATEKASWAALAPDDVQFQAAVDRLLK